jgi:uncharacterized protein
MKVSRNMLLVMGLATLFGMGGIGALLIEFVDKKPFISVFQHGIDWYYQIIIGLIFGFISAWGGIFLLEQNFMQKIKNHYAHIFEEMDLSWGAIIFISYCAGVGEEMLFRGAIQTYFGVIPTSIIFVAIHGYLNPKNWRLSIYGLYMTAIIIIIGYMYDYLGIITCMTAHFMIDVVLLRNVSKDTNLEQDY